MSDVLLDEGVGLYSHEYFDGSSPVLYAFDLKTKTSTLLMEGAMNAQFIDKNHFIYQPLEGAEILLHVVNIELSQVQGQPIELLDQMDFNLISTTTSGDILYFDLPEMSLVLRK